MIVYTHSIAGFDAKVAAVCIDAAHDDIISIVIGTRALVVELADTQDLGSCATGVQVQVLSSAP